MMTNLFSIFDPSSSTQLNSNWISSLILIIFIPSMFWIIKSRLFILLSFFLKKLINEINSLLGPMKSNGSAILFISLLFFIMINNFMGLYPYIFTSSSHMMFSLSLSFPLWLSFIIYGWYNFYNFMLAHLVPQNTPNALMLFMVLIETISNIIRPLTLAVRLSANMIAGHLLMTLLGNQTSYSQSFTLFILLFTQMLLLTLESAVCLIQSYVFAVLSSLYSYESTF